jgi:hypothetical protein
MRIWLKGKSALTRLVQAADKSRLERPLPPDNATPANEHPLDPGPPTDPAAPVAANASSTSQAEQQLTIEERCLSALLAHRHDNWSAQQFASHLGISRAGFYRLLKDTPTCKAAWESVKGNLKHGHIDQGFDSSGRPTASVDGSADEEEQK